MTKAHVCCAVAAFSEPSIAGAAADDERVDIVGLLRAQRVDRRRSTTGALHPPAAARHRRVGEPEGMNPGRSSAMRATDRCLRQ